MTLLQRSKIAGFFARDAVAGPCSYAPTSYRQREYGDNSGDGLIQRLARDSDVIAGSALAALGVFILLESNKWEYVGFDGPGPGFFPLWYGLAITLLSLWLVVGRALTLRHAQAYAVDWPGVGRALGTWAVFAGCVALMPWLGFVLSFALLSFILVRVQFARTLRTALFTAAGLAAGFYAIFPVLLDVPLPAGFLGF
jgi:putative tricarboxylic transport membrane protein